MKLRFIIEADENGYTQETIRDGVILHKSIHVRTPYGSKQTSKPLLDDAEIDDELYEILDGVSGYDFHQYCINQTEN